MSKRLIVLAILVIGGIVAIAAAFLRNQSGEHRDIVAVAHDDLRPADDQEQWSRAAPMPLEEMTATERNLRAELERDPENRHARRRLISLLAGVGRVWDARSDLISMLKDGGITVQGLALLADSGRGLWNDERLSAMRQSAPDDPLPLLGLAAIAQLQERRAEARLLLESIVETHPELIEAQARLGELLTGEADTGRFLAWQQSVPTETREHPRYWRACGMMATGLDDHEGAARCYWEALRREPNNLAACYQLGNALSRLERRDEAEILGERARALQRVATLVDLLYRDPAQPELIEELTSLLEGMGRYWEVEAWRRVARAALAEPVAPVSGTGDMPVVPVEERPLDADLPLVAAEFAPAALVNCAMYSLPEWAVTRPGELVEAETRSAGIRFETADAGIDFHYFNSADPSTPGARMFEFTGGGVGVLDYDADGAPDLYFPQGREWSADTTQRAHLDRLFRHAGDRYRDVTPNANLVETGFSQGVACGDYDNDGFSDIYVANIGPNRLFRNNGDGTFSSMDVLPSKTSDANPLAWTVSAAMADLNGDGLPELFDVNYVEGDDTFDRICMHDGVRRACSPTAFTGQPDRLLLNRGDGTFEDATGVAAIDAPNGTGLGIVAADFDGSGQLSLFVANDAQNNHFYTNLTASKGSVPRFEEQAIINGTAFDHAGHAQACMGVAAGDADGDGRLDLFVTNYVDESNTLYRQAAAGLFVDASRSARFSKPSFDRLGFGTQFLDADLDGWEDVIVVNGHVDDFTHKGYDYQMPAQVFRNVGGTFEELPATTAGPFFAEPRLGRGLARLDWNGDGRDEFAVSHLDAPAALLTNTTQTQNRSLRLRFVGTDSARDAIGTTVIIENDAGKFMRQLTAGDGYEASNERKLVIGVGTSGSIELVTVRWPSGKSVELGPLETGVEWLVIEGREEPLRLAW